jgi:hypothetical protein
MGLLGLAQIVLLVLGEHTHQKQRDLRAAKDKQRPVSAALATAIPGHAHLAQTAAQRHTALRVGGDIVDDGGALLIRHDRLRLLHKDRQFDNGLKSSHLAFL